MNHTHYSHPPILTFGALVAAFALSTSVSEATLALTLTDSDGLTTEAIVPQGSTFTVQVNLESTSEQTTGLSYFLEENGAGYPHLQIVDRNTTGSPYSFLTSSDFDVVSLPGALLNPTNGFDLGAGIANLNNPLGVGLHFVADITLRVLPSTPEGTYMLQFANVIAAGAGPDFSEIPVTTFQYTVVAPTPEPGSALLLAAGGFLFGAGSRRRSIPARLS